MTLEEKVHLQRLRLFRRAEELGNVSEACREAGIARSLYYQLRKRFRKFGADGSEVRLPMTDLVRTHSKRFVWRFRTRSHEIEDAATDAERERLYDRALRDAWSIYHRRQPDLDLVAIRVRTVKVHARRYLRESENRLPTKIYREVQL